MDYTKQPDLHRDAQYGGTVDEQFAAQIEGKLKQVHTCMPGIIDSFDADKQTATVQPAIKRIFTTDGAVNLPLCVDVPVAFPGGGDFFMTFPVKKGDECMLFFSERAIDFWYQNGGVQLPAEYRMHDLSDAMAVVGINSQPRKLANVQTTGAELRTRDRSTYFRMEQGTIYIKGNIQMEGDLQLQGNVTQQGNQDVTGKVTATDDVVASGKSLKSHTHTDPQGGSTGQPQ